MGGMMNIEPPEKLTERQVKIAKAWVQNGLNNRLPQGEFVKKFNMSTATLSKWLKNPDFSAYVQELKGELISSDELRAYDVVKKHILARVNSDNPTEKEINMYLEHFDYVVQYEKQKAMQRMGITEKGKPSDDRTVEDKKASLLTRLKSERGIE
ncbi:phBC6A51 family helix-turn-helix protein [Lentibacillus jeotgali]|uniref:phBC6A51 family helix-turn-helix protein n=1 Tax=Lentibacillus jeotgali TaxID=558169 RepID=UPI000262589E|nr:phBC6A51 family helix-turn-helix protein [Lentibacillus jeotgali]